MDERDAVYAARARRQLADGTARALRRASGLSQGHVGAVLGVCDAEISHYEAKRRHPRGDTAVKLGRLLERLEAVHGSVVAK